MGWIRESAPNHEGYLVGIVRNGDSWRYRELWSVTADPGPGKIIALAEVQVGCECGWPPPRRPARYVLVAIGRRGTAVVRGEGADAVAGAC